MTTPSNIIRLYDRSRTVTDWQCSRKRYYQYEYDGRGIVPAGTALELFMGTTIHDALAAIATQHQAGHVDIDLIAQTAFQQLYAELIKDNDDFAEAIHFAAEQSTLVEGLIRGFYKTVWPVLMAAFPNILAIEQEMLFRHDENGVSDPNGAFGFMSKPDLVVSNLDGDVYYIEYKSTKSKGDSWLNSWNTAVQLHSTMRAIEQTLNVKTTGCIVQGLYKGYESYGKQNSPFCYAYQRGGNPPFTKAETRYAYTSGFKRFPSWQLDGGIAQWVDNMPGDTLAEQFPCTPPIFPNERLVDAFFAQRAIREAELQDFWRRDDGTDALMNKVFPQKFDQCIPYFGRSCSYRSLCFGYNPNPLIQGFTYRVPHHIPEEEHWNGLVNASGTQLPNQSEHQN